MIGSTVLPQRYAEKLAPGDLEDAGGVACGIERGRGLLPVTGNVLGAFEPVEEIAIAPHGPPRQARRRHRPRPPTANGVRCRTRPLGDRATPAAISAARPSTMIGPMRGVLRSARPIDEPLANDFQAGRTRWGRRRATPPRPRSRRRPRAAGNRHGGASAGRRPSRSRRRGSRSCTARRAAVQVVGGLPDRRPEAITAVEEPVAETAQQVERRGLQCDDVQVLGELQHGEAVGALQS